MNSFVVFGHNLFDGSVTSTVLFVILVELALLVVVLLALCAVVLYKRLKDGKEKDYYVSSSVAPAEVTLKEIVLDTGAVRRRFMQGETFTSEGLLVTALYSDGTEKDVSEYSVEPPELDNAGEFFVTVRYENMVAEYAINVEEQPRPERVMLSIETDIAEVTTEFDQYGEFSSEGLKVYANFSAEPYREEITNFTVTAPDMTVPGNADVVVSCEDLTCAYSISIAKKRMLTGIALNISAAKTDYILGEEFTSEGLAVFAQFDAQPFEEQVYDFTVTAPDVSVEGVREAIVSYEGLTASYQVAINKAEEPAPVEEAPAEETPVEEEIPAEETPVEEEIPAEEAPVEEIAASDEEEYAETGVLRYDRSFTARLIQSENEVKQWYSDIKNCLLSYKKVKERMSWKKETFRCGKDKVARLGFRGKILCLYLALDPKNFEDSKYKVEDVSENSSTEEIPCLYRIKNDKRAKYALQLIEMMMENLGVPKIEREAQDYYLPYEGTLELINKGLIKREIKPNVDQSMFAGGDPASAKKLVTEIEIPEEESLEAGVLRYDRSFTARLIQSDDAVKQWYGDIKNCLLSYEKVKERMSWKKETFRCGMDKIARLGFRGKILCLYLALDPNNFVDSKYKVEDASENSSTEEIPCLYRIKNDKRAKYALQLIEMMMENMNIARVDREPEDYYLPYEGIVELIKKGLAKREIKPNVDQSMFRKDEDGAAEEPAAETYENDVAESGEEPAAETYESDVAESGEEPAAKTYESDVAESGEEVAAADAAEPSKAHEYVAGQREYAQGGAAAMPDDFGGDIETDGEDLLEWSFMARLYNSYDSTKVRYGALKNEILSYDGVECISDFENESYSVNGKNIAKFVFIDSILCLFLAVNPKVYDGVGYLVKDVSDKIGYEDTPLMFAVRSDRDARMAVDLISDAANKFNLVKFPRIEEDYYVDHKEKEELIAVGLIKVHKF